MYYLIFILCLILLDQTINSSSFAFLPPVQSSSKYQVYDVYSDAANIANLAQEWVVTGLASSSARTSLCGSFPLLGGLGITGTNPSFTRVYTDLPSHTYVNYCVSLFFIDHWEATDKLTIQIAGQTVLTYYPADWVSEQTLGNICGGSDYEFLGSYIGQVAHSGDSISVQVQAQVSSATASFGIFQVILSFSNQVTTSPLKNIQCTSNNPHYTDVGAICTIQKYYNYATHACEACDPSCYFCWGPGPDQCFACGFGFSFDGTQCVQCPTSCGICSAGTCDRCSVNLVLNSDGSCTSTCTNPAAILKGTPGIQYCVEPCSSSQFMLWNYTCSSTCNLPLQATIQSSNLFCTFPCDADKYLYWNGTCSYYCNFPYAKYSFHDENFAPDSKYCNLPCKTNEYVFGDYSCSTSCPETMESTIIDSIVKYCYTPTLSPEEQKKVEALNSAKSTAGKTGQAALAALNILLPSNPTSLISGSLQQALEYLRYLNISRSQRLEAMFAGTSSSGDIISIPPIMTKIQNHFPENSLPYMFEKYQIESSFLVNFGDQIISLAAIYALSLLSTLFNWLCKWLRNKAFLQFVSFRLKISLKNYFLGQLYQSFGLIFFFTALEFISSHSQSDFNNLSFLAAIICIVVVIILLARHYWIIHKYQRLKLTPNNLNKFRKKYQDSELLFGDFEDASFLSQAFLFLSSLRSIFCNLIISLLTNSPMSQIILINIASLLMLSYLLVKRPLKNKLEFIQQICFETVTLVINLSFFANAVTDKTARDDTDVMKNTSEIIIVSNMIFAFLPLVFLAIRVLLVFVVLYKRLKMALQKNNLKQRKVLKRKIDPRKGVLKTDLKFLENSEMLQLDRVNSSFLNGRTARQTNHGYENFQRRQSPRKHVQQPLRRISGKDTLNGLEIHRIQPLSEFERFSETKTNLPPGYNHPAIIRRGKLAQNFYIEKTFTSQE